MEGEIQCLSQKTNEKVIMEFHPKTGKHNSHCTGAGFDSQGRKVLEISGSWLTELNIKDLRTGRVDKIWEEKPLIPDAHLQNFFNFLTCRLNQKTEEMKGIVSPTDTRFRGDLRLYEEGEAEEADKVKVDIEEEQRRKRRLQEAGEVWKPNFFEEVPHPFLKEGHGLPIGEEHPIMWKLIEGEKGYWERRARGDWSDMPNLWGPFDQIE